MLKISIGYGARLKRAHIFSEYRMGMSTFRAAREKALKKIEADRIAALTKQQSETVIEPEVVTTIESELTNTIEATTVEDIKVNDEQMEVKPELDKVKRKKNK